MEQIRAFFALGAPPHPPSHHSTNVYVYAEGGTVRVLSKWMTVDRASRDMKSGDYRDVVVRIDGAWRIRERIAVARWFVGEPVRIRPGGAPPLPPPAEGDGE